MSSVGGGSTFNNLRLFNKPWTDKESSSILSSELFLDQTCCYRRYASRQIPLHILWRCNIVPYVTQEFERRRTFAFAQLPDLRDVSYERYTRIEMPVLNCTQPPGHSSWYATVATNPMPWKLSVDAVPRIVPKGVAATHERWLGQPS
jgi:hypothetical protein